MASIIVSTGSSEGIAGSQSEFLGLAEDALSGARDALDALGKRKYINSYSPSAGELPSFGVGYTTPSGFPVWRFRSSVPNWDNNALELNDIEKYDVPIFSEKPPNSSLSKLPGTPRKISVRDPGYAPNVNSVTIPDLADLKDIADPREWAIHLPSNPNINVDDFNGTHPDPSGITSPSTDFNWTETDYSSTTLDDIAAQISAYFSGGTGIPEPVWEAIWARDNDRENRSGEKLITEINEEWSSRGFQLPQGIQVAQIAEARQQLQSALAGRSRDISIQEATLEIENLKFAVQQGIALENMKGGWYQQAILRSLDAAKFSSQLAIDLFNAEINFYNAQVQTYSIEATVYKVELEAELSKLEVYKTELEGQKLIGDLNLQQVQIYKTRVDALGVNIDHYNATIQALKLGVDIDSARINAYSTEVQAYSEKVKAASLEYQLYETEMKGAKIEADIYATEIQAFSSKVQAYSAQVDASAKNSQIDLSINTQKIEEYNTLLKAYSVQVDAALNELKSEVALFDSQNKAYSVKIDNEKNRSNVELQTLREEVSYAGLRTQASIAGARSDLEGEKAEAALSVEALKQVAHAESAIAGSALSVVNLSQNMSDSAINTAVTE